MNIESDKHVQVTLPDHQVRHSQQPVFAKQYFLFGIRMKCLLLARNCLPTRCHDSGGVPGCGLYQEGPVPRGALHQS